jgi:hypothetical protein
MSAHERERFFFNSNMQEISNNELSLACIQILVSRLMDNKCYNRPI